MDLTREQAERLVEILAYIRHVPKVWIGVGNDIPAMRVFLEGFLTGLSITGPNLQDEWKQLLMELGWESGSAGPGTVMRRSGMSDDEITEELVTTLIKVVQRRYDISDEPIHRIEQQLQNKRKKE